jgi:ankyrin repeat protein
MSSIPILKKVISFSPRKCEDLDKLREVNKMFRETISYYLDFNTLIGMVTYEIFVESIKQKSQILFYNLFRDNPKKSFWITAQNEHTKMTWKNKMDINELLFLAVVYDYHEIIPLLISWGADPNYKKKLCCKMYEWDYFNNMYDMAGSEQFFEEEYTDDDLLDLIWEDRMLKVNPKVMYRSNTFKKIFREMSVVMIACYKNSHHSLRMLIKHGASYDDNNNVGDTPLLISAEADSNECLEYLLSLGVDHKVQNIVGDTALILSADAGSYKNVKTFIDLGTDFMLHGKEGFSFLLFKAVQQNWLDIVKLLLENGEDVNQEFYDGKNIFRIACIGKSFDVIDYLLDLKFDINRAIRTTTNYNYGTRTIDSKYNDYTLHEDKYSDVYNTYDMSRLLLVNDTGEFKDHEKMNKTFGKLLDSIKNGYFENARVNVYFHLFEFCKKTKRYDIFETLLNHEKGKKFLDQMSIDDDFSLGLVWCPRLVSRRRGYIDHLDKTMMKMMLDKTVNPIEYIEKYIGKYGSKIIQKNDILRLFLSYDTSSTPIGGETKSLLLGELCDKDKSLEENENFDIIRMLLEQGVDAGYALCSFIRRRNLDMCKYLFRYNVNVNYIKNNRTALSYAVEMGYQDKCKFLIDHHADPNIGKSPLNFAVLRRNYDICELLLKYGANPNPQIGKPPMNTFSQCFNGGSGQVQHHLPNIYNKGTNGEESPLKIAIAIGSEKIFDLLLKYGSKITSMDETSYQNLIKISGSKMVEYLKEWNTNNNSDLYSDFRGVRRRDLMRKQHREKKQQLKQQRKQDNPVDDDDVFEGGLF